MSALLMRSDVMESREVEEELFVASRGPGRVYHMNQIAGAIWRALEQPMTERELVDLFAEAFPDQTRAKLESDIGSFVRDLVSKGLIEKHYNDN